jgi:putative nucleotide binding protein
MKGRKEEYAYVIDTLPPEVAVYRLPPKIRQRFPHDAAYAHLIGEKYFTLLEVTLKEGASVEIGERVYIGPGVRDKVGKIVRRISYGDLQPQGRESLRAVLRVLVQKQEQRFVKWINQAGPLTLKLHSLELLRGIGKKKLQEIIEERRKRHFASFEDVKQRVGIDLVELLVDRILRELAGEDPYYIFVAPPPAAGQKD